MEEVHHVFGRNWDANKHHRINLASLCRRCHADIVPILDISVLVALKAWKDPENFDLALAQEFSRRKNGRVGF